MLILTVGMAVRTSHGDAMVVTGSVVSSSVIVISECWYRRMYIHCHAPQRLVGPHIHTHSHRLTPPTAYLHDISSMPASAVEFDIRNHNQQPNSNEKPSQASSRPQHTCHHAMPCPTRTTAPHASTRISMHAVTTDQHNTTRTAAAARTTLHPLIQPIHTSTLCRPH